MHSQLYEATSQRDRKLRVSLHFVFKVFRIDWFMSAIRKLFSYYVKH